MKVLWLTNVPLSKVKSQISSNTIQTGGWLDGISAELLKQKDIDFLSIFPFNTTEILRGEIDKINYLAFPINCNFEMQKETFKQVIDEFKPDLIHIFGTEFNHTLNMLQVCEQMLLLEKTIVSIQGLMSIYAKHYEAGLPNKIVKKSTVRDFIKRDNIKQQKKKYAKRGESEIQALKICRNVIGRTDWDRACVSQINPNITYYHCNETLRNAFYEDRWQYGACEKHSIFVSQCNYPIKGFHMLLQAMPLIIKEYPDAKIYTTGKNLLDLTWKDKLKLSAYQKYIIDLIRKNKLENRVKFLGMLNENKMKNAYLKANCFVSCSSIENSPNSVGEAMLLGVPTISSDVGGVKNMLTHNEEGFVYPFDEEYMLAYYVCEVFKSKECQEMTNRAVEHATKTHNKQLNVETLIKIYNDLLGR